MRFPHKLVVVSSLLAALGAGCQVYDFEPVSPLAIAQKTDTKRVISVGDKPNLMLLVDRSGSMNLPIAASGSCPSGCGVGTNFCPSGCATRWTELQAAMNTFLNQPPVARMGLTIFPSDTVCGASNRIRFDITQSLDVPAELASRATEINGVLQGIVGSTAQSSGGGEYPVGGTPIGLSLSWVGDNVTTLRDPAREDFVLLLTDGAPNCNPNNPASTEATCRCTLFPTTACFPSGQPMFKNGCLDDAGSTTAVQSLVGRGIKTIVVGFGADTTSGDAFNALNDMASAGGFARSCPGGTDAECGNGNVCLPTRECQIKYYAATNAQDLSDALTEIASGLDKEPCLFRLDTSPSDNEFISVILNGTAIDPGPTTWTYDTTQQAINFPEEADGGTICPQLRAASNREPANLEFRVVQSL